MHNVPLGTAKDLPPEGRGGQGNDYDRVTAIHNVPRGTANHLLPEEPQLVEGGRVTALTG
jgi:hypothetical protein